MKHFRQFIITITIILCVAANLSARPLKVINMKIEAHPQIASTRSNNNLPTEESKIMRIVDIQNSPQMLGNKRGARLHLADGAYPVYYSIASANGQFGKHIRALESNE